VRYHSAKMMNDRRLLLRRAERRQTGQTGASRLELERLSRHAVRTSGQRRQCGKPMGGSFSQLALGHHLTSSATTVHRKHPGCVNRPAHPRPASDVSVASRHLEGGQHAHRSKWSRPACGIAAESPGGQVGILRPDQMNLTQQHETLSYQGGRESGSGSRWNCPVRGA